MLPLVLVALLCAVRPAVAQPRLSLPDGPLFEFGEIVAGEHPTHVIRLANAGSDTLRIRTITVQCRCSTTRLSAELLPPGGTGTLEVTFQSDFYRGGVEKGLSIITNDPAQPITLVRFRAEVLSLLEAEPRRIVFTLDESTTMAPKQIVLTNHDTSAIHILSIVDSSHRVEATKPALTVGRGKSAFLQLVAKPVGEASKFGVLELRTDNRRQPLVRLNYLIEGSRKSD